MCILFRMIDDVIRAWMESCSLGLILGLTAVPLLVSPVQAQPSVDSVVPHNVQAGNGSVSLVATLGVDNLPPDQVQPASFDIGTLSGLNILRNGTEVSGDFDFPTDYAEGTYDVTITFPSPRGELVSTLTDGFSVGAVSTSTGLVFKTDDSYPGYTLFSTMGQSMTYLVDHAGNVAHTWNSVYNPNLSVYLQDDGSILRPAKSGGVGVVEQIDKEGNLVWSWSPSDSSLDLHHDIEPLPNGNLLMIAYSLKTEAEAIAAGRRPSSLSDSELWSECIIEVKPGAANGGETVWEWCVWDHLVQDYDPGKPESGVVANYPERVDLNYAINGNADWLHANGIDYNADLDQIVISLRNIGEIWIIDHSTSVAEAAGRSGGNAGRGGDLLYRWGNPQVYGAGGAGDQQLFGQHDAQWIDSNYPGGGNILVFNNGQGRTGGNYSSVDEIVLPLSGYNYTLSPGSAWGPAKATWSYADPTPSDLYASRISGAQRLPNGNTLICDGPAGEFFEVTTYGEMVWDYLNIYPGSTPGGESFETFRAIRFPLDATPMVALGLSSASYADLSYPIVDTGLTTFYDNGVEISAPVEGGAFYGQDAHFNGHQPAYTLSDDGLSVYDRVTGLTWTQSPDLDDDGVIDINDKLTFAQAQAYADTTLNHQGFAGYSDWRLPSMKELYSLMNFTGIDISGGSTAGATPFIDTNYFEFGYGDTAAGERNIDAQFWSSNAYVGSVFVNQAAAFGLNLADGRIKGYPTDGPVVKVNYVYFVRGNSSYGSNDLADNGDGTITDHATGLMWSQDDSGTGLNWEEALTWVEQMNEQVYLGYSNWRLPNAKELQSIIDYTRSPETTSSAAIDPVFNVTGIINEAGKADYPAFWSNTTHLDWTSTPGTKGVYIVFGRAMGYMNSAWIDVHGAGAQRSDPKAGNPAEYPTGQGPQGDAIRIYNYARPLRDDNGRGDAGCPDGNDVIISGYTYASWETVDCSGKTTITAGPDVIISPVADVTYSATDSITLSSGFNVSNQASFRALIAN